MPEEGKIHQPNQSRSESEESQREASITRQSITSSPADISTFFPPSDVLPSVPKNSDNDSDVNDSSESGIDQNARTQEIVMEEKLPTSMPEPSLSDLENLAAAETYESQTDAELQEQYDVIQREVDRMNFILGDAGFVEAGKQSDGKQKLNRHYLMSKGDAEVYLQRFTGRNYHEEKSTIDNARLALYTELKHYFTSKDIETLANWGLEHFREHESRHDYGMIADIFMSKRGEYVLKKQAIERELMSREGVKKITGDSNKRSV